MDGICKNLAEWAYAEPLVQIPQFDHRRESMLYLVSKRSFDLIVSFLGLALMGPVLVAIAVLLKSFGHTPTLLRERRIGRNGRAFFSYGFLCQSSRSPAVDSGITTRLEQFLRNSGIEYLPQLFNVLRGDMSIVGPAALNPRQSNRRLSVPPGLIHLQARHAFDVRDDDRDRLDAFYIQHRSFLLDMQIILNAVRAST